MAEENVETFRRLFVGKSFSYVAALVETHLASSLVGVGEIAEAQAGG
ncbi:MAG: hypothetical protein ACJ75Z_05480 [Solirubrobacterales bacterium]